MTVQTVQGPPVSTIPARQRVLLALSAVALLAAWAQPALQVPLASFGATLALIVPLLVVGRWVRRNLARRTVDVVLDFLRHDAAPCVVTDLDGNVCAGNDAAARSLSLRGGEPLAQGLRFVMGDPGRVLERLFKTAVYFRVYSPMSLDQTAELQRWRARGVATPSAPPPAE